MKIDRELQSFVQSGVAMVAATRDPANVPALTRGGGCRVLDSGSSLRVYLATDQSSRWLDIVRQTRSVAVVFVMPHSYECFQVKGRDASVVELDEEDRDRVRRYREAFFANLRKIGMTDALSAGLLPDGPGLFVGLEFTPSEAFCQTPGPGAGSAREARP